MISAAYERWHDQHMTGSYSGLSRRIFQAGWNAARASLGEQVADSAPDVLFDVPESLSPYHAWLKRHQIKTWKLDGIESEFKDGIATWYAGVPGGGVDADMHRTGEGDTEDQAIADLCRKLRIPVYGEEELKGGA